MNVINPMVATWQMTFINSAKVVFKSFDCTKIDGTRQLDMSITIPCDLSDARYAKVFWTGVFVLVA